jgi:hypothetical protein
MKTDKKFKSVEERLPIMQTFHCKYIYMRAVCVRARVCVCARAHARVRAYMCIHINILLGHIWCIQNENQPVCDVWGAFPPENIWNMDQIPLPFCINLKRSLNPKGESCWIAVVGPSGLDKRQCTLQSTIRAKGPQLMKAAIIFRGAGNIEEEERMFLDGLQHVACDFRERAWVDERYILDWAKEFCDTLDAECPGNHLLFLDECSAQNTQVCAHV